MMSYFFVLFVSFTGYVEMRWVGYLTAASFCSEGWPDSFGMTIPVCGRFPFRVKRDIMIDFKDSNVYEINPIINFLHSKIHCGC